MPTTTVDLPEILNNYVEDEVEKGRYKSKSEAIRSMFEKKYCNVTALVKHCLKKLLKVLDRSETKEMKETLENLSKTSYRPEFRQRFVDLT